MASPRLFSLRTGTLNQLAVASRQARQLHITGAATQTSPLLASERSVTSVSSSLGDSKTDGVVRDLKATGTKAESMSDDIGHSRSFSTVVEQDSKRPTAPTSAPAQPPITRAFNTSRALKAVKDSSPIDFAYMPQLALSPEPEPEWFRVPLAPDIFSPRRSGANREATEPDDTVIRPEISTVSADSTHIASPSAMSDVVDNAAIKIDPYTLTDKVSAAASRLSSTPIEELKEPGTIKQFWSDFLDDLLGGKRPGKA